MLNVTILALMDKIYKIMVDGKSRIFKYVHNFSYAKILSENAVFKFI